LLEFHIRGVPLSNFLHRSRQLVVCLAELAIDLDRVGKLNGSFLVLPLLEVLFPAFEEVLLSCLRIAPATHED